MFDTKLKITTANVARPTPLEEFRAFVEEHCDAMLDAADLLGGTPGTKLAQSVLDGLDVDGAPSRRTLHACEELLDLLMLEHVHEPWREEAARFAAIDPASACVEEICLLADGLSDALEAYRASTSANSEPEARRNAA